MYTNKFFSVHGSDNMILIQKNSYEVVIVSQLNKIS